MYLALYRKYRPRTFDDVISQEHITTTLKNQLKSGQHSHAYLFTGSRGTGKTTCAKILAKALNCKDLKDGNPCLECDNCKAAEGEYTDTAEIDAASNSGVDFIRELKEEAFYSPIEGKYRIYIIDEIHMLSTASFNALLKLIEEPPPHVVFIFATTEVHKIPATIISRCQRFEFRRIDINDSKKRLLYVASEENKSLTEDAAMLISKISEGGMRDALSLLDQCFSVSDSVDVDTVRECAGISGTDYLFEISGYIVKENVSSLLNLYDGLIERSKDPARLCEELISHYRTLMLIKYGADNKVLKLLSSEEKSYREKAEEYPTEHIFRCISMLSETFTSLGRTKNPALMMQMCFIAMCDPKLETDEKAIIARLSKLEAAFMKLSRGISEGTVKTARSDTEEALKSEAKEEQQNSGGFEIKIDERLEREGDEPPLPSVPPEYEAFPPEIKQQSGGGELPVFDMWSEITASLPFSIKVLVDGTAARVSGNTVYVEGSELAVNYAVNEFREKVEEAVENVTGKKYRIAALSSADVSIPAEKENKVSSFLDLARSKGVKIKEL